MEISFNEMAEQRNHSRPLVDVDKDDVKKSLPSANKAGINFLASIDFRTLGKTVFTEVLGTVSNIGKEIGELTVTVEETTKGGEICYLVHAHSHGIIDDIPCGTSVTAYIARGLVTLEQTQHEYMKIPGNPLDRKIILQKQGGQYFVKMITTEGETQQVKEKIYNSSDMIGFISEGSNAIIQRVMAIKRRLPDEEAEFVSFDTNIELCTTFYSRLEDRKQSIDNQFIDVIGIEKSMLTANSQTTWRSFFLDSGHMASRRTLGSPVTMQLFKIPKPEENEEPTGNSKRRGHRWEEDMQFWSRFLDRREELKSDHSTYILKHPELKALMKDFLQFLLLRKPDDVCTFASHYFEAFASVRTEPTRS